MKFANFVYFCITREKRYPHYRKVATLFRARNTKTYKICKLHMTVFSTIYDIFQTKLHHFTKFMMLFPAVLMNFPNLEVCLIGKWSIVKRYKQRQLREDSVVKKLLQYVASVGSG